MGPSTWKILLVDNNEDDYLLTRQMLSEAKHMKYDLDWANSYEYGWEKIINCVYDAVLINYDLGTQNGLDLIRKAIADNCDVPFILFTVQGSYEVDMQAMEAGAAFYLTKSEINPHLLERGIRYAIERNQDEHALAAANKALAEANALLTEQKRELDRRLQEQARLASFPEMNPNPILELDISKSIHYINPHAQKLFPDLKEKGTAHNFLAGWDKIVEQLLKDSSAQLVREIQVADQFYQQSIYYYEKNQLIRVYGMDITKRKRAEEALRAYSHRLEESNRELENFAFIASHDLKEPLRKIEYFCKQLEQTAGLTISETERDYLGRMQKAAARMRRMIEDLLALSRVMIQRQPFTRVDLNQAAKTVLDDLEVLIQRSQGRVEVSELPVIQADPIQMHKLFQNLIGNALKFNKPDQPPLIRVYSRQIEQNQVEITVADNGIGFNMQDAEKLFQPFQRLHRTSSYEGSGIGLSICKKIVERHRGTITAVGKPGQGATFVVELPILQIDQDLLPDK
jgi:signal transduction histidine kinase/DNA-binding response OmpR family regulator